MILIISAQSDRSSMIILTKRLIVSLFSQCVMGFNSLPIVMTCLSKVKRVYVLICCLCLPILPSVCHLFCRQSVILWFCSAGGSPHHPVLSILSVPGDTHPGALFQSPMFVLRIPSLQTGAMSSDRRTELHSPCLH